MRNREPWAWVACCTMTIISVLVAQDFGAGRPDIARHVRAGLVFVAPMSLLVFALIPWIPEALSVMHLAEQARPHAETYLQIRLWGAPLLLTAFALTSYLRGIGDTLTPMGVALIANIFNALASAVLVFGWIGFPAMGVAGAAWGSVAASGLEVLLYAFAYYFSPTARAHGSRRIILPRRTELSAFVWLGVPIGVAWLFEMVAWTSFSVYAGSRPPEELAAHTILFQFTGFCFMPAMAIGIAASTLVGQYLGAQRPDLARASAYSASAISVAFMLVVGFALVWQRESLIHAFNRDATVVALGSSLAFIAALYQPFDGLGMVAQGVLRGAKHTAIPTIVMLGSGLFVFIPLVWWLGTEKELGIRGAWIAALVHVVVVAILLGIAVMRSRVVHVPTSLPVEA